jgi:sec-independent protein translocase protein TatB
MLDLSPEKLVVLAVIAIIVLGPERFPKMAYQVGRFMANLRRMSSDVRGEVHKSLAEPRAAVEAAIGEFKSSPNPNPRPVAAQPASPEAGSAPQSLPAQAQPAAPPAGEVPAPDDPSIN